MNYRKLLYRSISFLKYLLFSRHKGGHGIHSPFVYDFIVGVFRNKQIPHELERIEEIRSTLRQSDEFIWVDDLGSGHLNRDPERKSVSRITRTAATRRKYGRLLYKISRYAKPTKVLELGTSLGFGSMYLGMANQQSEMVTIDGCKACSGIAERNFKALEFNHIRVMNGAFQHILPQVLKELNWIDLVYFDGDHSKAPLLHYFETALSYIRNDTIFIIDDIHWSIEMEKAWESIKKHPRVKVTLDLFQLGIVFFRKELQKQDFLVRFL